MVTSLVKGEGDNSFSEVTLEEGLWVGGSSDSTTSSLWAVLNVKRANQMGCSVAWGLWLGFGPLLPSSPGRPEAGLLASDHKPETWLEDLSR